MLVDTILIVIFMMLTMQAIMLPTNATAQQAVSEKEFQMVKDQIIMRTRAFEQSHGLRDSVSRYQQSLSDDHKRAVSADSRADSLPAVPSGLSPDFKLPPGTERQRPSSQSITAPFACPQRGWCYIVLYPDGRKEEQTSPTIDISYPPKDASPHPRLIVINQTTK